MQANPFFRGLIWVLPVSVARAALILAFVTLSAIPVLAQANLNTRFSGYLEHQYSLSKTPDRWRQLDYDRLRAELEMRTRHGSRASASVVYQLYRGDTTVEPSDYLPRGVLPSADSLGLILKDRHYVNHAYIVFTVLPELEITVGKQYLTWGASWVFNPTELFRPKNTLEPAYDREGVGAISMRISLGSLSDLLIAMVPDGSLLNSGKVLRLRHHVWGFDVSALAAVKRDAALGATTGDEDRRYVLGGDITGELLGLGIWSEGAWVSRAGAHWSELTLGGNYTLTDGTLLMAEAFFNGLGKSDSPYAVQAWLDRLSGNRRTLGRTTVFGMISRPFGQLWTLGISALANPGDQSFVIIPSVAYSFADNIDLLFNGVWYSGETGDEFGFEQTGGFLRGRLYF